MSANAPMKRKLTPKRIALFLSKLANGFSPTAACAAANISRTTIYRLRNRLPEFRERWDLALEQGSDILEDEMRRRALEGVEKPVFYQGVQCGSIQEYSDTLLIFSLKARRPEKYRENIHIDVSQLDNAIERQLALLAARSKAEATSEITDIERIN